MSDTQRRHGEVQVSQQQATVSSEEKPKILVTGASGDVGSKVVELLCSQGYPVRAMVHRMDDRADALKRLGAEVVAGDLTELKDVREALMGCKRVYFGMSVSPKYLEATVNTAVVAKAYKELELFVNISQMTVSQMSITATTPSPQQRLHFLSEQVLNWSSLPVVHVRATVFMEHPFFRLWGAKSIRERDELRLPFGLGRTSPIATDDVARVVVTLLTTRDTRAHSGRVYELTGPRSMNGEELAQEYSQALGRTVEYVDVPQLQFEEEELIPSGLPTHVVSHIRTMAEQHREGRYDRFVTTVEKLTGTQPQSLRQWVQKHRELFETTK